MERLKKVEKNMNEETGMNELGLYEYRRLEIENGTHGKVFEGITLLPCK
jgi:hypothetical protein